MPQKGKRKGFRKAYLDYYPYVFNIILKKVGVWDEAEDICQEVFIIYYDIFQEIENNRKWMSTTINNVVMNYYRRKKKTGNNVDIDDHANDPHLGFENGFRDTRIILSEAFENMDNFGNETNRTIFELVAINNYTLEEVGKLLGIGKQKVRYNYNKTIKRLTDYLKKQGIENIESLL